MGTARFKQKKDSPQSPAFPDCPAFLLNECPASPLHLGSSNMRSAPRENHPSPHLPPRLPKTRHQMALLPKSPFYPLGFPLLWRQGHWLYDDLRCPPRQLRLRGCLRSKPSVTPELTHLLCPAHLDHGRVKFPLHSKTPTPALQAGCCVSRVPCSPVPFQAT